MWPRLSPCLCVCVCVCVCVCRYFTAAEAASPKSTTDAGYHYCKGLYARCVCVCVCVYVCVLASTEVIGVTASQ